jgi:hypothetical protein
MLQRLFGDPTPRRATRSGATGGADDAADEVELAATGPASLELHALRARSSPETIKLRRRTDILAAGACGLVVCAGVGRLPPVVVVVAARAAGRLGACCGMNAISLLPPPICMRPTLTTTPGAAGAASPRNAADSGPLATDASPHPALLDPPPTALPPSSDPSSPSASPRYSSSSGGGSGGGRGTSGSEKSAAAGSGTGAAWSLWYDPEPDQADDEGVSHEERCFRMWINSLGLPTKCGSLFGPQVRSGWMLLEVLDCLQVRVCGEGGRGSGSIGSSSGSGSSASTRSSRIAGSTHSASAYLLLSSSPPPPRNRH